MKRLACLLIASALTVPLAAEPLPEFVGRVAPQLALDTGMQIPLKLISLTAGQAAALPAPLAAGDKAYEGEISFPLPKPVRLVLVRPRTGEPFVYVDRDQDGKLSAEERFALPSAAGSEAHVKGTAISLPLNKGTFSSYPLMIFQMPESELAGMPPPMKEGADAMLLVASLAYIEGRVAIDGKEVLVRVLGASSQQSVDPRNASIEMDVDGDGRIDPTGSRESQVAKGEDAIFRIGERYVSLRSVDLAAGKMVLESHPASAYQGFDLAPGKVVPDFSFVDLEGKPHKLSDWRGRYLLLDFWATWCAPCIAEFPSLKQAHAQYHPRGFEIVSVLYHDDDDKARKFLAAPDHQLPWLQATAESTRELVDKRLLIQSVPATILLDPQGRVVSAGGSNQPPLRGEKLAQTLAQLFPAKDAEKPGKP